MMKEIIADLNVFEYESFPPVPSAETAGKTPSVVYTMSLYPRNATGPVPTAVTPSTTRYSLSQIPPEDLQRTQN